MKHLMLFENFGGSFSIEEVHDALVKAFPSKSDVEFTVEVDEEAAGDKENPMPVILHFDYKATPSYDRLKDWVGVNIRDNEWLSGTEGPTSFKTIPDLISGIKKEIKAQRAEMKLM